VNGLPDSIQISSYSVIELAQGGDSAVDPVALRLVGGELDGEDIVGGVARGREDTATCTGLVDWSRIC